MDWKDCLQYAALTHVGMRRTNNQDSHAVMIADSEETWNQRGHFFIVADGMGGHAGGEIASKQAAESIPHLYHKYRDLAPPEALIKAIQETNAEVNRRGTANLDFRDMGTTATSFVLLPQGALAGHIGDSRLYRLRGDTLRQLTFDHSVDWELRAAGHIQEGSQLAAMVPKNQITRSLGPNPTVQVDLEGPYPLEVGDTFLACSDGLVRKVEDDEIAAVLSALPPQEAAQALIDLANLRGGPDNITVIIAKVVGPKMATTASTGPLQLQQGAKPRPVHPLFWLVPVVCFLAGIILAISNQLIAGGVAAAGGLVGLGIALTQGGATAGRQLASGQRLGRGPYTETKVAAQKDFLKKLFLTTEQLREAAVHGHWEINWAKFDRLRQSAEESNKRGEWQHAVRDASLAISFLLNELRHQNEKKSSDSSIEY